MAEPVEELNKGTARSIRFAKKVWKALDVDAHECGRSASKQLEQLLKHYYSLDATEIDQEKLAGINLKPTDTTLAQDDTEGDVRRGARGGRYIVRGSVPVLSDRSLDEVISGAERQPDETEPATSSEPKRSSQR